ncbi:hypothetical protein LLH06_03520 [Mucilaginibacter daejeonensis]|uniref:hypothetical protein n=1 Tax=Mucilaginibacter daejeonensis TaxID=398049 RepID=UPI001D1765AA|nr:hypothetical protein [Mucilaginibacter daejeonensis]UEG54040.1 hypothetical protein LLH06_03520 [Mucilaginibacter daejeonensis]
MAPEAGSESQRTRRRSFADAAKNGGAIENHAGLEGAERANGAKPGVATGTANKTGISNGEAAHGTNEPALEHMQGNIACFH